MHPLYHPLWPSFVPNQHNLYGGIIADVAAILTWPPDIPLDRSMRRGVWPPGLGEILYSSNAAAVARCRKVPTCSDLGLEVRIWRPGTVMDARDPGLLPADSEQ